MKPSKTSLILPIVLITFGVGWLLTTLEVAPEIDWTWTLGLAVVGVALLFVVGIDKVTVVCAPILVAASILSVLRQYQVVTVGVMVPVLVILVGALLLIARNPSVPSPRWITAAPSDGEK